MLDGVGKVVQRVGADSYYTSDVHFLCSYITYMQFNTDFLHSVFYLSLFRHVSALAIGHFLRHMQLLRQIIRYKFYTYDSSYYNTRVITVMFRFM
jgi:hypothetical protein